MTGDGHLPRALYLLCHDLARGRMGEDNALLRGQLLRAAAVAELRLTGRVTDSGGRARRAAPAPPGPDDGFLGQVLAAVPPEGSAGWFAVLDDRWEDAEPTVRDRLAALGEITVDRRRWFGFMPYRAVGVRAPAAVHALRDRVRSVVLSGSPEAASSADAVLAVLALDGDVRTVFAGPEHRRHRTSVRALGARVDAELPGLRTALSWAIADRRTEASA